MYFEHFHIFALPKYNFAVLFTKDLKISKWKPIRRSFHIIRSLVHILRNIQIFCPRKNFFCRKMKFVVSGENHMSGLSAFTYKSSVTVNENRFYFTLRNFLNRVKFCLQDEIILYMRTYPFLQEIFFSYCQTSVQSPNISLRTRGCKHIM